MVKKEALRIYIIRFWFLYMLYLAINIVLCFMLIKVVLYCIVLYCIVLYCIVLYCIVLYCIVLYGEHLFIYKCIIILSLID